MSAENGHATELDAPVPPQAPPAPDAGTLHTRLGQVAGQHDKLLEAERDLAEQLDAVKQQRQQLRGQIMLLQELINETQAPPVPPPLNRAQRRTRTKK